MCTWVGSCPFPCWLPVGQCERDQLSPPSISHHLVLSNVLTEALIIAPRGHRGFGKQLGKGDGLVDVHLSVCLSVPLCPHHSPFRRCIYCIHAAGMFTTSAFPVSRGKQLDAPPWHRLTSSRAAATAPSCSRVTRCLSASAINGFLCWFCWKTKTNN